MSGGLLMMRANLSKKSFIKWIFRSKLQGWEKIHINNSEIRNYLSSKKSEANEEPRHKPGKNSVLELDFKKYSWKVTYVCMLKYFFDVYLKEKKTS